MEPSQERPPHVSLRSHLQRRPLRQLARQSALSAALDHRAVLGRQRHRRPPRRRAYSAGDAVVPALVAGVPCHSPLRLDASEARPGCDPQPSRHHDLSLSHRDQRLQHPAILVARTHHGAEHAAAAVGRAAVRRGLVADPARHPLDAGAGRRDRGVADRRTGDPAARRPDGAHQHRVQQGRYHLHRGAGDLRAVFGAVAEASGNSRPVVCRLHLRLRCRVPGPALDLGTDLTPGDAARCGEPAVAVLRRGVSVDARLSVLQSRRAADRRQPRRAILSCGAGVRIGDGDRLSRRAPAAVPHYRLCAGADRRIRRVAQAGESALANKRSELALFGPGLRSARRLVAGPKRASSTNPTTSGPSAEIETPPGSGNLTCAISALFWSTRNRCRIAARIRSREKVRAGHDLDVASSRDLDDCPRSLTKEATMNSTGAVARANFQIPGILLWFAPRSIMMRKLFRQVTIVAFTSLSLISASLADDTKVLRSAKAHPAKSAHLSAASAAKTKAQHSTKAHRLVIQVDQNDPAVMNLALNNATNVIDYYRAK